MAADPLWINANAGAPAYSAAELRQAMAGVWMYAGRAMGARQGIRPGITTIVSVAGSTITVQPHAGVLDPALTTPQGPYWYALPAVENPGPLNAADATNPRKDLVIVRVYDHDEDASGQRFARSEYLAGTAAPSPAAPAVPAGAFALALIDVPQSGGGSPVVTQTFPYTVAAGGILPVRVAGDIAAGVEGRYRDRLDTDVLERDSGAAWVTAADPAVFTAWTAHTPTWTGATTNPVIGNGTITARYKQIGKTVHYTGRILMGSTTTYGSGRWQISLPVTAQAGTLFTGSVLTFDATGPNRACVGWLGSATTLIVSVGSGGDVDAATPQTWAVSDQLRWSITYEAA